MKLVFIYSFSLDMYLIWIEIFFAHLSTLLKDITVSFVVFTGSTRFWEHVWHVIWWNIKLKRRPTFERKIDDLDNRNSGQSKEVWICKCWQHHILQFIFRWMDIYLHSCPSPGSLQHSSQAFVFLSFGPWSHWQDSIP